MYIMKQFDYKQENIALELLRKPSIDLGIHWLNPLWVKFVL